MGNNGRYALYDEQDEMELQVRESNEVRQLLKGFLIASIKSRETGILDGEDIDNFFVDYENSVSETHIFSVKLSDEIHKEKSG